MGWRLVSGLAALAAVALLVTFAVVALGPEPGGQTSSTPAVDRALAGPWNACARAVRENLPGRHVDVEGPVRTRWDQSGAGVDFTGRARGEQIGSLPFGCHAVRDGDGWQVTRLIFSES